MLYGQRKNFYGPQSMAHGFMDYRTCFKNSDTCFWIIVSCSLSYRCLWSTSIVRNFTSTLWKLATWFTITFASRIALCREGEGILARSLHRAQRHEKLCVGACACACVCMCFIVVLLYGSTLPPPLVIAYALSDTLILSNDNCDMWHCNFHFRILNFQMSNSQITKSQTSKYKSEIIRERTR